MTVLKLMFYDRLINNMKIYAVIIVLYIVYYSLIFITFGVKICGYIITVEAMQFLMHA